MARSLLPLAAVTFALAACSEPAALPPGPDLGPTPDTWPLHDGPAPCPDPDGDYDGDGLSNRLEGCLSGRDSDGDRIADWQDFDSDGDQLPDRLEAGGGSANKLPDSDGDKYPDHLDRDSDDDGLLDGEEDFNHDGVLGCCLKACNKPDIYWQRQNCKLTPGGCGQGQACQAGRCTPTVDFLCAQGETSPLVKDSYGDGLADSERGTEVCRDSTGQGLGRKPTQFRTSTTGDWLVALEKWAMYSEMPLANAWNTEAAAAIDYRGSAEQVAGFVVSRDAALGGVGADLSSFLSRLRGAWAGRRARLLFAGYAGRSHDLYHQIRGVSVELERNDGLHLSSARNRVVAALLGRTLTGLSRRIQPYGPGKGAFLLRLSLVWRYDFKLDHGRIVYDAEGYPLDSGDLNKRRLVAMGALVERKQYLDGLSLSGVLVDDLSNGSSLAARCSYPVRVCDAERVPLSSAVTPDYQPISTSLVVTLDRKHLMRSKLLGFDYRANDNDLVFSGLNPRAGAEVLVSYRRWARMKCCW